MILTMTPYGFYCAAGDFYIDPWRPVKQAVVTHAHGDHCVRGCERYLIAREGEPVFRVRLGDEAQFQTLGYGETIPIGDVRLSFHPAGHILGSAQVRIEHQGEVWVVSGDYKTDPDTTCTPFEVVKCHHFITEATFGLPIYHWQPASSIFEQINQWWRTNADRGKNSLIYCYALGKAQRIIANVDSSIGSIFTHGAVERLNDAYRAGGVHLPVTKNVLDVDKSALKGAIIIAPLSARGTPWINRLGNYASGFASGWMRIRGARRQRAVDRGFILSDHADWDGLMTVIKATGAETIGVTHGYVPVMTRWLQEQGFNAYGIETQFTGEAVEPSEELSE